MSKLEENSALATARAKGTEEGLRQGREEGMQKGREEGLQKGREEGMQKGKEEGIKQGEKQTLIEIARKMKNKEHTIDEIVELTGLSEKEIKNI